MTLGNNVLRVDIS